MTAWSGRQASSSGRSGAGRPRASAAGILAVDGRGTLHALLAPPAGLLPQPTPLVVLPVRVDPENSASLPAAGASSPFVGATHLAAHGHVVSLAGPNFTAILRCTPDGNAEPAATCVTLQREELTGAAIGGVAVDANGSVFVASGTGLTMYEGSAPCPGHVVPQITGPVQAMAVSADGRFLAASLPRQATVTRARCEPSDGCPPLGGAPQPRVSSALWIWDRQRDSWQHFWLGGLTDGNVTALSFTAANDLWAGGATSAQFLSRVDLGGSQMGWAFHRVAGLVENPGSTTGGLPVGNISLAAAGAAGADSVWLGSANGLIRAPSDPRAPGAEFRLLAGPRYLPSDGSSSCTLAVQALAVDEAGRAFVATCVGVAVICSLNVSLAQKARVFDDRASRHAPQDGLFRDLRLSGFGNTSAASVGCGESDGLWSSLYLASQALRYGCTGEAAARANAWKAFGGLELLANVTGVRGLIARTAARASTPNCGQSDQCKPGGGINKCFLNSTAMPGYTFMSSLSSDSLMAHMLALPLMHDLVAATPGEKARTTDLLQHVVAYIVTNGFYLIDVDGKRTDWGVWNPTQLNDNPAWYEERGLNSAQVLGFLLAASHCAPNASAAGATFGAWAKRLAFDHGFAANMLNQRITAADDVNFSDDQLAWLSFYLLARYSGKELHQALRASMARSFRIVAGEQSSLFDAIMLAADQLVPGAGSTAPLRAAAGDLVATLQNWPLETVDWPVDNTARLDFHWNRDAQQDPSGNPLWQPDRVLRPDESPLRKWNANPFQLAGGGGSIENVGSAFLLPYWLACYHGLLASC